MGELGNCLLIDRLLCKCHGTIVKDNHGYCRECGLGLSGDIIDCDFVHPRTRTVDLPRVFGQCCPKPDVRKGPGNHVCIKCWTYKGPVFDHYRGFDYFVKTKAVHDRIRWFRNMIVDYVWDDRERELLIADFQLLVRTYEKHNLVKGRNVSVYGYYILRLARRRRIRLMKIPRTVKTSRARTVYNERYREACKILGWKC